MTKKSKTETSEEVETTQTVDLTHTALGVFQDETTGQWALARVRYNPATGQAGTIDVLKNEEGTREAVNLRFKIAAVSEGLVT